MRRYFYEGVANYIKQKEQAVSILCRAVGSLFLKARYYNFLSNSSYKKEEHKYNKIII